MRWTRPRPWAPPSTRRTWQRGLYLIFLLTFAQQLLLRFMPHSEIELRALRQSLLKYKLHQDAGLFERAYGYIRQHY